MDRIIKGLPIPETRFFDSIGSTNDEALTWADNGALDGCLVLAERQLPVWCALTASRLVDRGRPRNALVSAGGTKTLGWADDCVDETDITLILV